MTKKNKKEMPLFEGTEPEEVFGETLEAFTKGRHVKYDGHNMTLRDAIIHKAHMGSGTVTEVLHGNTDKTSHYFRTIGAVIALVSISDVFTLAKMEIVALWHYYRNYNDNYLEEERIKNTCRKHDDAEPP